MIRLTKETDYGIVLLSHFAGEGVGSTYSARVLAAETQIPLPMVSKILKVLTFNADFVILIGGGNQTVNQGLPTAVTKNLDPGEWIVGFSVGIEARNGSAVTVFVDEIEIVQERRGPQIFARQREVIDAVSADYPDLRQLQGVEISYLHPHLNEFSVEGFGSPENLARSLFADHMIPFELASILLLVAMVGALMLSQAHADKGEE